MKKRLTAILLTLVITLSSSIIVLGGGGGIDGGPLGRGRGYVPTAPIGCCEPQPECCEIETP